jgi:simple sugar transport system permease protein
MKITIGLINGMIAAATPILLAALGGTLTYYAGIFNIAMEGMMLGGAFFAVLGSYYSGSWVIGIICAILGSLFMAMIFIVFSIFLKTDEFITGVGLNLFALGATTYLLRQIFEVKGAFAGPGIVPVPNIDIPFTSGVSKDKTRIWSLVICGILCGIAGAYLSTGYVTLFSENMSAGRGWISLAAVILVDGHPLGIALISLLFGFSDGLGLYLQNILPSQFTSMVPYVATLIALFIYSNQKKKSEG